MSYFTNDRLLKYGYGSIRLFLLTAIAFTCSFQPNFDITDKAINDYLRSIRWIGHAYIGSIGAFVNVQQGSLFTNMVLLAAAAAVIFWDIFTFDYSIIIYLIKTFGGDFFAGKLDTFEWRLVLTFVFAILLPLFLFLERESFGKGNKYSRILPYLFVIQLICEYGDAHYEKLVIFRHRYAFELLTLSLLLGLPMLTTWEIDVVRIDLFVCLFYRLSNLAIIAFRSSSSYSYSYSSGYYYNTFNMLLLRLLGLITGVPYQRVQDPALATLIMKQSADKGDRL